MTATERGCYIHLLAHLWNSDNRELPNDIPLIARLGGVKPKLAAKVVSSCFDVVGHVIRNDRVDREWKKQQNWAELQSVKGKKGAKKRWHQKNSPGYACAIATPMAENSSASASASSSASASAEEEKKNITTDVPSGEAHPPTPKPERKDSEAQIRIKKVIAAYLTMKNITEENKAWVRAEWPRMARASKRILEFCLNDADRAQNMVIEMGRGFNAKDLTWTLETVAKNAENWRPDATKD